MAALITVLNTLLYVHARGQTKELLTVSKSEQAFSRIWRLEAQINCRDLNLVQAEIAETEKCITTSLHMILS